MTKRVYTSRIIPESVQEFIASLNGETWQLLAEMRFLASKSEGKKDSEAARDMALKIADVCEAILINSQATENTTENITRKRT